MGKAASALDSVKRGSQRLFVDPRGSLSVLDLLSDLPFVAVRMFWIFGVPVGGQRGAHAHKLCSQFLICCQGTVEIEAYDGSRTEVFTLSTGDYLHCVPGIFLTLVFKAEHSVVNVFCDRPYEAEDYIYDKTALAPPAAVDAGSD